MAHCQQRSLSGSTLLAGAALLVLLIAVEFVSSAVAPTGDSVAEDPLASALTEGEVQNVFEAAVERSAASAAAAAAEPEALSSHSAAQQCPGCKRERMLQEMGEAQLLAEMRRWRLESFGREMLSRLGLSHPPQMSPATLAALQRSPPALPEEVLTDAGIGVDRPSSASDDRNRKGHFYIFAAKDSHLACSSRPSTAGAQATPEGRSCLAFDLNQHLLASFDSVRLELFVYYNATAASKSLPRVRLASGVAGDRGEVVSESVKVSSANHGSDGGSGGAVASGGQWLHVELSWKAQARALENRGRLVLELTCGDHGGETAQHEGSNEAEVSCDGSVALSRLDPRRPFIRVSSKSTPKARRDTSRTVTCEEMDRGRARGEGNGGSARPRACCLETLRVNFHRDLNYTFVVHPLEYDINFCRGSCDGGPGYKRLYTHAVIAEYVAQRRQMSERFSPCCSPARMTGLSVIIIMADGVYRDAVMPNMSVSECGCA